MQYGTWHTSNRYRSWYFGKKISSAEEANRAAVRCSLVAAKEIIEGSVMCVDDLTAKRPGNGVSPMRFWEFVGRTAGRTYQADDAIIDE